MSDHRIEIKVTPAFRKQLEELAASRKTTLSGAIKSAVMEVAMPDGHVPTDQEVLEMLGRAARAGNVSAMKELRAHHRANEAETETPLAVVDELAQRRTA